MKVTMNMWYKSTITLFTVLLCAEAIQDQCSVVQFPQAHVTSVGSSVTLGCRFKLPASVAQFRINWLYSSDSHAECSNYKEFIFSIVHPSEENKMQQDPEARVRVVVGNSSCELMLNRVEQQGQGMYFCQVTVEIPTLLHCCGNGTWVEIETHWAREKGVHEDWWIWLAVGLGAATVASSTLGFFVFRRKRREEVSPIYVNVGPRLGRSPAAVTPRPGTQPQSQRRPAEPKSLKALSVPMKLSDTNSLKTQGREMFYF